MLSLSIIFACFYACCLEFFLFIYYCFRAADPTASHCDVCCASKVSPRTLAAEVDCTICGAR